MMRLHCVICIFITYSHHARIGHVLEYCLFVGNSVLSAQIFFPFNSRFASYTSSREEGGICCSMAYISTKFTVIGEAGEAVHSLKIVENDVT